MRRKKTAQRKTLRQRRKRRRIILTLFVFALFFGAGWATSRLTFSEALSVVDIKVEGNSLISAEEVIKIIKKETASAYLGIFSKNNILLLPRKKIEKEISSIFKTVEAAEVSFDGIKTIKVSVQERAPFAVWCGVSPGADCFYLDKTGYIFEKAGEFSGTVYFKYSGASDEENGDTGSPIGSQFISKEEFVGLSKFIDDVGKLGIKTIGLKIRSVSDAVLELSSGGKIIFSRKVDYTQTIQNLDSVLSAEETRSRGTFLSELDYIDVRLSGKAYVKMK